MNGKDPYEQEVQRYLSRTRRCSEEWERAKRHLPLGVCGNFRVMEPHPIFVRRASGSHLEDVDGNDYVDYSLGQTAMLTGHAHPVVLEAVHRQIENGSLTCIPSPLTAKLASVVCERFKLEQVRFTNTGSESTLFAARVARGATGRDKIIKFEVCYHGSTAEFMIGKPARNLPPDAPAWMSKTEWSNGIPAKQYEDTVVAEYNVLDSVRTAFAGHPRQIAAVIMEPICLNNSLIMPREEFIKGVRELCDREGAVLIYDEVKIGCKLGLLGAGEFLGVQADLVTMAKSFGGGFPIGLFGGRRDLMRQIEDGGVIHMGTYAANPVSMAAAYATLTEVLTPETYERIFALNRALTKGYREIIERTGLDAHVVSVGTVGGFLLGRHPVVTRDDFVKTRLAKWPIYWLGMLNRGVIPQGPSAEDNWTVSAQHTEQDIERALRAFREVAPLLA
ncbi:MAG: aminotransferase class III-fold pyridoxal phosphate-dependent enzyme [Acidobacteriota bacterium]